MLEVLRSLDTRSEIPKGRVPDKYCFFWALHVRGGRWGSTLLHPYPDNPKTSQAIEKFFRTIQKLSGLSGNFPGYPETFWTIWKIFRLSENFPDHPEIFQTVWKLPSAISRVTRKNFPDAQKLSGWQCHDATMVFVPLGWGLLN